MAFTEKERRPISDEEIVALYRAGHSQNDIMRRYDVSVVHTRRVLQNAGFTTHTFRSMSRTMMRVVRQLVPNGVIYRDIETVCDISFHAVRDYVLRTDLKKSAPTPTRVSSSRRYNDFTEDIYTEFFAGYRAGKSFCALVEDLDLSDSAIFAAFSLVTDKDIALHRANLARSIEIEHAKDFSPTAVARKLNISRSIVRALLRG